MESSEIVGDQCTWIYWVTFIPPWTTYNDMNCIECLMNKNNYPRNYVPSNQYNCSSAVTLVPHWFHSNLEMIKQASLDFVVPTDLTENSFSKIPGLTDYCMYGWFYGHLHRWFCDWYCTCQGCFFIDAMVKTVTINDYARKDEFYPFMHDQWTINTSKVKTLYVRLVKGQK